MADPALRIHEIFFSIQGESLFSGLPTVFVRTAACPLRCVWCDTKHAFGEGEVMPIGAILDRVRFHPTRYVCVTGGEPLGQKNTLVLLDRLVAEGYTVSLETSGSFSVRDVPPAVVKVVDVKCPGSGEVESMDWGNLSLLGARDQVKFVIASREDFEWAAEVARRESLTDRCHVLFSPVHDSVSAQELAEWTLESGLPVRVQLQLHKIIWGADARGV